LQVSNGWCRCRKLDRTVGCREKKKLVDSIGQVDRFKKQLRKTSQLKEKKKELAVIVLALNYRNF